MTTLNLEADRKGAKLEYTTIVRTALRATRKDDILEKEEARPRKIVDRGGSA